MLPKIAVIGNGAWGRNLVRNFHALGVLKYVCDSRPEALQEAHDLFGVDTCSSVRQLIDDPVIFLEQVLPGQIPLGRDVRNMHRRAFRRPWPLAR